MTVVSKKCCLLPLSCFGSKFYKTLDKLIFSHTLLEAILCPLNHEELILILKSTYSLFWSYSGENSRALVVPRRQTLSESPSAMWRGLSPVHLHADRVQSEKSAMWRKVYTAQTPSLSAIANKREIISPINIYQEAGAWRNTFNRLFLENRPIINSNSERFFQKQQQACMRGVFSDEIRCWGSALFPLIQLHELTLSGSNS